MNGVGNTLEALGIKVIVNAVQPTMSDQTMTKYVEDDFADSYSITEGTYTPSTFVSYSLDNVQTQEYFTFF